MTSDDGMQGTFPEGARLAGSQISNEKFSLFRNELKSRYGDAVYQSWFSDLLLENVNGDTVTLSTGSTFKADTIAERYRPWMQAAWSAKVGPIAKLSIIARAKMSAHAAKVNGLGARPVSDAVKSKDQLGFSLFGAESGDAKPGSKYAASKQTNGRRPFSLGEIASPISRQSTFENFAVDESNNVAHAAAQHIFMDGSPCELVYIYGPSGVGKTHLLHAIGNLWGARNGAGRCAYFTYNNMINGCVRAVLSNSIHAMHQDMLKQDIIEIDDIHLLSGRARTEEEVLNLVNAFAGSGRQLVIAGELPPAKLAESGMNERLADRLAGGLCVPVLPGDEDLRLEVLKKRFEAAPKKCTITDDALAFIARQFPQSMREAIGALNQLLLVFREEDMIIGLEETRVALAPRLKDRRRKASLEEALTAAANAFGLTVGDVTGRAQPQRIVRSRHAFVYVGREALNESFPRIAAVLGRDHTTAMSSYRRAQALIERDAKFQAAVADIRGAIGV